jgi:hypothetical protein
MAYPATRPYTDLWIGVAGELILHAATRKDIYVRVLFIFILMSESKSNK